MAANDLNAPLTRNIRRAAVRRPVLAPFIIASALVVALVAGIWVAVVDDPQGGRPVAVAAIQDAPAATGSLPERLGEGPATPDTPADSGQLADSLTAAGFQVAGLPAAPPAVDGTGLTEPSAFGPLPRIGPDGSLPRNAYAGRMPPLAAGLPRVAIVVGGLGLSQTGTQSAIQALPEGVTLAFAPYGSSLQRWVDQARSEGHEVLLQIPMEPLSYPQENPGEHTLRVSADPAAMRRDLAWNLGRMTSYAGVMNYMGAGFTANERALAGFLGEVGARGLFFLDDGTSDESRADSVGENLRVPVLAADAVIDTERSPAAVGRALDALEALARERGFATGIATAFPGSVAAIADWASSAAGRGIALVPVSAGLAR
jgi:polysaccharide deacetylase 2 family uncharacterized protein YibQ